MKTEDMFKAPPHVIPYQGSKRKIAKDILGYMDFEIDTLYEPFVGSGAITLAAAANNKAKRYSVADKLEPLAELWRLIIDDPDRLADEYAKLWSEQLEDPAAYFRKVRDDFNRSKTPAALLYLVARCVKNAVRFNASGEFNQGPDNRRLGLRPEKLRREANLMSKLLKGKVDITAADFREAISEATENDLVYMDPPWQGTSGKRDPRYAFLLNLDELVSALENLNERKVPFILSFDGTCGDKAYGKELPSILNLERVEIHAGRSSQATLLGRTDETIESLYLSPALLLKIKSTTLNSTKTQLELLEKEAT